MHGFSRRNAIRGVAVLAAGAALAAASRPMAAEPAALAIKGYDPVAYFVDGRPVRGRPPPPPKISSLPRLFLRAFSFRPAPAVMISPASMHPMETQEHTHE